jgi:hypothetical protein
MLPELRYDSLSPSLPSPPPPPEPPPSSSPSGSAKPAKRKRKHLDTPTAQGVERVARIERQRRRGVVRLTTITRLHAPLAGGGLPFSPTGAPASAAAGSGGGVAVVVRGGVRERALLDGHSASRRAPTGSSGQTTAAALSRRGAEVERGEAAVVSWRGRRA